MGILVTDNNKQIIDQEEIEVIETYYYYEKAFDQVKHTELIDLLCERGVDQRDSIFIKNI